MVRNVAGIKSGANYVKVLYPNATKSSKIPGGKSPPGISKGFVLL